MTVTAAEPLWTTLHGVARTAVTLALVDPDRLHAPDSEQTTRRWKTFMERVEAESLPRWGGRLVKSVTDGLMLEFPAVSPALNCAVAAQRTLETLNAALPGEQHLRVRVGVHAADGYFHERDIHGRRVDLASRLATLAEPGQIVVSITVRDSLVPGLDPDVEHIGACYLQGIAEPVNAYRIRPGADPRSPKSAQAMIANARPTIAIIPFEGRFVSPPHDVLGELIADAAITRLSANGMFRMISRLSTSLLRGRSRSVDEIGALLGATAIASGSYQVSGDRIHLTMELADARTLEVIWADEIRGNVTDMLVPSGEIVDAVCAGIVSALASREMRRAQRLPLPTLDGFSLQLAAMTLMHRSSINEFDHASRVLKSLIERYPRVPEPRAWLAKWHVLRVTRGLATDFAQESARALEQTQRALDAAPDCSLALAVEGFVHCHMLRDLDGADGRLHQALSVNPSDSLAWLFSCVVQAFRGNGEAALTAADKAIELSPLDPLRHYYDALACTAALAAGNLPRTIELAQRALRVNRDHPPTLRALTIAQVESGAIEDARQTVKHVLALEPGLTLRDYVARGPKGGEALRARYAAALGEVGVPSQ